MRPKPLPILLSEADDGTPTTHRNEVLDEERTVMTMTMILVTAFAFAAVALFVMLAARSHQTAPRVTKPTTPLDHAERILASRYARGVITAEEYERMLTVLRR